MRTSLALLCFAVSSAALAGSLKNSDVREYRVVVSAAGKASPSTPVGPEALIEKICTAFPCTVENMETTERVTLTCAEERIELKDGVMTVKLGEGEGGGAPAPAPAPPKKKGKK